MPKKYEFTTSLLKPLPDIEGQENTFFAQLINQSAKNAIGSKRALGLAKKSLKDRSFIINSCRSLKGFHTHNPKIYDAKVKGRVFATVPEFIPDSPYIYTDSISFHHDYGWAGNAKYISNRYLLCTEFVHNANHTTLYHEFLKESSELVDVLIKMGLTRENCKIIKAACHQHKQMPFPEFVPPYQVQALIPTSDEHEYISVSPLSSLRVQAAVHNFCWTDEVYVIGRAFHNLLRPENIGALATATEGSIAVLSPELRLQNISKSAISQITAYLREYDNLLLTEGLDFNYFLKVQKTADFASNRYTPNPKSPQKAGILNQIQKNISLLFSRLDTLRFAYQSGKVDESSSKKLTSSQRSYVIERQLSESDMSEIWRQANAEVQKHISQSNYRQLAYHPTLIRYISDSIRNHLKPLYRGNIEKAKPELYFSELETFSQGKESNSASTYLLVPHLTVFNAHADSSPYTTGLPSITALIGFADRLRRNIVNRFQIDIGPIKVAWMLRSFQPLEGIKRHEPARWNDKTKKPMSDIVSRKFCNLSCDLIIQCNLHALKLNDCCALLPECLPTNFASGSVSTIEEVPSDNWKPEAFRIYSSVTELLSSLREEQVSRWAVIDYSSCFKRSSESILNDLSEEFCSYKNNNQNTNFLSVSSVGYKLLETPAERPGSRVSLHAYAEAVVGIQELRLMSSTSHEEIQTLPIFWSYKEENHLLLCKASLAES